jgi:peptide/nickel transport system permease protein
VRTARAKGLAERYVVAKHALRNALIPLVTIVTYELPFIFGGTILIEQVFGIPGMGLLYIDALVGFDFPVTQAYLLITAVLTVVATLLSDILYTVVDPRIRLH